MGMAASQVRFLSLQNRKNTIGLNLMTLSNRKTSLSRDMNRVAQKYNDAMNQKLLKWSNDSGSTYQNLNYDLLMKQNDNNGSLPYIISTADGKVVVDDKKLTDSDGMALNYSYKDLAKMISEYSGTNSTTGKAEYNNTNNISSDGNNGGASKTGAEYEVISSADGYNFQTSLRYDLFKKLGLINSSQEQTYNDNITELYGSQAAQKAGNYSNILSEFDANSATATSKYGSGLFGTISLDAVSGNFVLNGGCAVGNLALAKAYQTEYNAYLNTPMSTDFTKNTSLNLGSTASRTADTAYNSEDNTGISNRILSILSSDGTVSVSGGNYTYNIKGLLTNDMAVNESEAFGTLNGIGGGDSQKYRYVTGGSTSFGSSLPAGTTWAQIYNTSSNSSTTLDSNNDGYLDDAHDNIYQNVSGTAVRLGWRNDGSSTESFSNWTEAQAYARQILTSFSNSLITANPGMNQTGLNWAKDQTIDFYKNGTNNSTGCDKDANDCEEQAAKRTDDTFGFGVFRQRYSKDRMYYMSVTSLMNTFLSIYQMYQEVGGDTSRISTGNGEKSYNAEIQGAYGVSYNKDFQTLTTSDAIIQNSLASFNAGATSVGATVNAGAFTQTGVVDAPNNLYKGSVVYSYSFTNDSGATSSEFATVAGTYNTATKVFTAVSSVSYERQDGTDPKYKTYDLTKNDGYNVTQNVYSDGNDGGTAGSVYSTTKYTASSGGTSAVIDLASALTNSGNVQHIIVDSNGKITAVKNTSNQTVTGDSVQSAGSTMYITDENGNIDPNYKYLLDAGSLQDSVFTSKVDVKPTDKYSTKLASLVADCQSKVDTLKAKLTNFFQTTESSKMDYYDALFKRISENGWVYDSKVNASSTQTQSNANNYLNAMLENNMYYVTEVNENSSETGSYTYTNKLATNISKVFQVEDTSAENVALSEYETEKTAISNKEEQVDLRMNQLETEQSAITTELDSIKKIINDNVSSTFKIFT